MNTPEIVYKPEPERGHLTTEQIKRLLKTVRPDRIEQRQGLSYVPQHEVRAELVRTFGPGNVDHTMLEPKIMYETEVLPGDTQYPKSGDGKKSYWVVCAMVGCVLRIRDYYGRPVAEFTEYHVEENSPLPNRGEAFAMAVTSAESYALRRAAISLGDNFGLHLYNKGSVNPLIGGTLQIDGDLDSPDADLTMRTNVAMLARINGEVIESAQEPAQSPKAIAAAAAQDADAETPEIPVQRVDVDMNAAFKKPTTRAKKAVNE